MCQPGGLKNNVYLKVEIIFFYHIIIRKMGCGAVCSTETPLSLKHQQKSKQNLLSLLTRISINAPLLPETYYQHFSNSFRQNVNQYIIRVSSTVFSTEQCPAPLVQKWRVLLFGLDKDDYTYRRCVGFTGPKQHKTTLALAAEGGEESNCQYHSCFQQIQKDLNRTFDFKQHTKQLFQETLKKIANHFPTMGYTQGVNFVVGYLLILGYEANDAFWLFVHMAMNRRYLLLGLYEDGFPLANIYTMIFKNILKRIDPELCNHIYANLMLDDSVWIFKWFITCYLYSFPIPVIKYVWDVFIQMGSLGLVYFAVALVSSMRSQLIDIDDPCDMSQFLQSLKDLTVFNAMVKMDDVLEKCYELTLLKIDLEGIDQLRPSFYQKYYKFYQNQLKDNSLPQQKIPKKSQKQIENKLKVHIDQWWVKLLEERLQFLNKPSPQKSSKLVEDIPMELKEDYEEMQKSLKLLEDIVLQNESNKFSQHHIEPEGSDHYFNELVIPDVEELSPQFTSGSPSSDTEFHNRLQTKISYDVGQIDQLEEYSDSNGQNDRSQNYGGHSRMNPPSQEPSIYLEQYSNRQHSNINVTSIIGSLDQERRKKEPIVKANHLRIDTGGIRSGFGLAGQNILSNLSSCQSQHSSVDSKYTAYKPKKHKENNLPRTKSNKGRIDDYSQRSGPSVEVSSQHESSIDHRTEKDSYSNMTSRQNTNKSKGNEIYVDRRTEKQLMANSHGPDKKISTSNAKGSASEIEIFAGQGLFKKKKRTYNRNSIVTSINQDLNISKQGIQNRPKRTIQDQQSLQSVLELSAIRKNRPRDTTQMLYEIESMK